MKKQKEFNPEPVEHTEKGVDQKKNPGEMSRRQALAALGKFAVFTTPIMTTLLTSKKAAAWSSPPPDTPLIT